MTRVIHTGDTHLGYRQYHSPERRDDFLAAFRRVVEDAIEGDVDAVVHAGDLYHDRRPDLADLLGTIDILRNLRDADVPFLAVVGNHEGTRGTQWLDLFETLGLATRLDADGEVVGNTSFYGLDYVPESKRAALDYDFAPPETEYAALVTHGLFTPFAHAAWETEDLLDRANVAFDAVLLGDNHAPGTAEVGDAWVTYCGSTERVSAAEREDRGYNLVTFDEEVRVARRGIETRPFVFVDVDLAEGEGAGLVRERIRERDVEDAVLVVTVDGDGEGLTPADVEAFGDDQGALVTRVVDRREVADPDGEVDVTFADPDDAVRRRVREMGLSEAARDIDETVRTDDVADSNVRDVVAGRVKDLVDEDLAAFEPATDAGDGTGEEPEPTGDHGDAGGRSPDESDGRTDAPVTTTDAENGADDADETTTDAENGTGDADETADDDQVTMEDYL